MKVFNSLIMTVLSGMMSLGCLGTAQAQNDSTFGLAGESAVGAEFGDPQFKVNIDVYGATLKNKLLEKDGHSGVITMYNFASDQGGSMRQMWATHQCAPELSDTQKATPVFNYRDNESGNGGLGFYQTVTGEVEHNGALFIYMNADADAMAKYKCLAGAMFLFKPLTGDLTQWSIYYTPSLYWDDDGVLQSQSCLADAVEPFIKTLSKELNIDTAAIFEVPAYETLAELQADVNIGPFVSTSATNYMVTNFDAYFQGTGIFTLAVAAYNNDQAISAKCSNPNEEEDGASGQ